MVKHEPRMFGGWVEQVGWVSGEDEVAKTFSSTHRTMVSQPSAGIQPTNFSNRFGKARSRGIWAIATSDATMAELVTLQDAPER